MDTKALIFLGLGLLLSACGGEDKKRESKQSGGTADDVCATPPEFELFAGETDEVTLADRALVANALPAPQGGYSTRIVKAFRSGSGVDATHVDFIRSFDDVPLCGGPLRAHVVAGTVSLPPMPRYELPSYVDDTAFGEPAAILAAAAAEIGADASAAILRSAERCYAVDGQSLVPAYEMNATIEGRPYAVVGNQARIRHLASQAMHATANASVYHRNSLDGMLVEAALEVSEAGHLAGPDFKIVDEFGEQAGPVAVGGKFEVTPEQDDFKATTLIAHAQEMYAFFKTFRSTGPNDCLPIYIEPHASAGPVYLPSWNQDSAHPLIRVPNGDGKQLQNLALDFDAVAHEIGHHFVYQRMKALDHTPTRVIHEGMADFFVFAYTGDSCLAESICPADSELCVVPGKCLRSGDTNVSKMKFYTADYEAEPYHRQSQALSGMLMAMGADAAIGKDQIVKSTFAAIDFLKPTSEIGDFLEAVLQGNKAAFGGAHACRIVEIATEFGLTAETEGKDCASYVVPVALSD